MGRVFGGGFKTSARDGVGGAAARRAEVFGHFDRPSPIRYAGRGF